MKYYTKRPNLGFADGLSWGAAGGALGDIANLGISVWGAKEANDLKEAEIEAKRDIEIARANAQASMISGTQQSSGVSPLLIGAGVLGLGLVAFFAFKK